MMSAGADGISVVVPVFNERENLEPLQSRITEALGRLGIMYEVIYVDDGSTDGSWDTLTRLAGADRRVRLIRLRKNFGQTPALSAGLACARQPIVVTLDADGQHLPEELGVMIAPIVAGEADYVNGSRLLGYFEKESTIRHLGVHFFSWLVTILTGTRVTDISSGYRAARADLLRPLVLEQDQFWTSEILIEALRHHARIVEVPITILARAGGKSKKPKSLKYGWNFSKVIIQTWLR